MQQIDTVPSHYRRSGYRYQTARQGMPEASRYPGHPIIGSLLRFHSGSVPVPVPFRFCSSSIPVPLRFSSALLPVPVLFRCVAIPVRFCSGSVQPFRFFLSGSFVPFRFCSGSGSVPVPFRFHSAPTPFGSLVPVNCSGFSFWFSSGSGPIPVQFRFRSGWAVPVLFWFCSASIPVWFRFLSVLFQFRSCSVAAPFAFQCCCQKTWKNSH